MEAMVNRLFEFAKMDVSEYPVQREALPLRETLAAGTEGLSGDGVAVTLDGVPALTVLADRELLRCVAGNPLDNSRKHGGRETVHVTLSARAAGGMAEVTFADDGVGAPEERLPKLFDAFYRGDAARTAPGSGSGLGLAVVKKAVEAMGGTVRAENREGGGLAVIFTLPLGKEERHAEDLDH